MAREWRQVACGLAKAGFCLPFSQPLIRFYELSFIIVFSLFANTISNQSFGKMALALRLQAALLFVLGLCAFSIFATLDTLWTEAGSSGRQRIESYDAEIRDG